mgnify:CR=1 FL=1
MFPPKERIICVSSVGNDEKVASLGAWKFGKRPALERRTVAFCGARKPMQSSNPMGENPTDLSKRAVRALTEYMTVLPETGMARDADGLFLVVSQSGSEYLVDNREGRCNCPDAEYNLEPDERCKHERRVNYATGQTPIPAWVATEAIDPQLGERTATSPVRAATDGGTTSQDTEEVFDSPEDRRDEDASVIEAEREECPNGNKRCEGPDAESLPCFACYEVEESR